MLRVVLLVDAPDGAAQGIKEKLAVDFERFGDVKVVEVKEINAEQIAMEG